MTEINWGYRSDEYTALVHAVQTGVMYRMKYEEGDTAETSPKHLRTGVNSALCDTGALAKTLIEAGVITLEAYRDNLIYFLKLEVESYEKYLSEKIGADIKLG
jgi:hypothetical protein